MTDWSTTEIEPLRIRFTKMATEENASPGPSTPQRFDSSFGSKSILVQLDKFNGKPNDVIDWFASFERIARANELDAEKSGRMVSPFLRGPAGDHFEKIEEVDKTNLRVTRQSWPVCRLRN